MSPRVTSLFTPNSLTNSCHETGLQASVVLEIGTEAGSSKTADKIFCPSYFPVLKPELLPQTKDANHHLWESRILDVHFGLPLWGRECTHSQGSLPLGPWAVRASYLSWGVPVLSPLPGETSSLAPHLSQYRHVWWSLGCAWARHCHWPCPGLLAGHRGTASRQCNTARLAGLSPPAHCSQAVLLPLFLCRTTVDTALRRGQCCYQFQRVSIDATLLLELFASFPARTGISYQLWWLLISDLN